MHEQALALANKLSNIERGAASVKVEWNPYEHHWQAEANWSDSMRIVTSGYDHPDPAWHELIDLLNAALTDSWLPMPTPRSAVHKVLNALVDNAGGYDHSLVLAAASYCRDRPDDPFNLHKRLRSLDLLGRRALRGEVVTDADIDKANRGEA